MNIEEKQKCAETFEILTKQKTNPEDWNENAADLLAEMVAKLRVCSDAMTFVPHPSGFKPGFGYIVGYVYETLKWHLNSDKQRKYYEACLTFSGPLKRQIEIALTTGE